jgi:1-acyl-sn-glycerol-3-phosphate acyltransferase
MPALVALQYCPLSRVDYFIMLNFLPAFLLGIISWLLLAFNVLVHGTLILLLSVFKFLLPFQAVRRPLDLLLNTIAQDWVRCNSLWMGWLLNIDWSLEGLEQLDPRGWYLITANHQSWVDIFVLQRTLADRTPFLKFFLKRQLIYVPIVGMACWALDFPFMRRHSRAYLQKHPEKQGQDQAATRKSCERFSLVPTAVMNFLEGTRFTVAKHDRQQSPYGYLLKPKAGGIALTMNAMGEKFKALLDVTIFYPDGIPTMWDFLCGRVKRIAVLVREIPIPAELTDGDYNADPEMRTKVQNWLNALWLEKDRQLARLSQASGA